MFARLKSWLGFGASRDSLLREAARRRDEAKAAAEAAEARNDDRDRGRTYMVLRQATSDLLRLEVGR